MLQLPKHIYDGIIEQAQRELPNEACGLLVGLDDEVKQQFPLTNIDHSPEHFSFDPAEQFNVMRAARAEGYKIVANYHSHTETPSLPSEEDIRLAYDPNILYLIVSLAAEVPTLKAFRIVNGQSTEVVINII
jgi:[CysO sulfur-carrier protein]-S-L-cysteine hydrolase